jgi:tRNA(fMet)-specific endonuclease VapC
MYCLDTNIIIDMFRGDARIAEKIKACIDQKVPLFVTTVTLCELFKGAYLSQYVKESLFKIQVLIDAIEIISLDRNASEVYGKEFARLQKAGKMASEMDLLIAVITKVNNLTLITRNRKDFENIDVAVEQW